MGYVTSRQRAENESCAGINSHFCCRSLRDLQFSEDEHPIVAQIFSSKPEMISSATKLVAELGFDGVDINMGCPDRAIEKQGCGAALMKNPKLAVEIIRAAKEASELPVSVKTRVGYTKESLDEWLPTLLEANPSRDHDSSAHAKRIVARSGRLGIDEKSGRDSQPYKSRRVTYRQRRCERS